MLNKWIQLELNWAPPVAQTVKNLPAIQDTQVQSLGWEVPLEKRMATHSSILAWRIPWTEKPGIITIFPNLKKQMAKRRILEAISNEDTCIVFSQPPSYKSGTITLATPDHKESVP